MKNSHRSSILGSHKSLPLIAKCGLAFPSNWYIKPGELSYAIWRATDVWRPHGIRLGRNADALLVEQVKTGGVENMVGSLPGQMFRPLLTDHEYMTLLDGGIDGCIIDVPYTRYEKPLPIMDPEMHLDFATIPLASELRIDIRNIGPTPQLVRGAIFFYAPYDKIDKKVKNRA